MNMIAPEQVTPPQAVVSAEASTQSNEATKPTSIQENKSVPWKSPTTTTTTAAAAVSSGRVLCVIGKIEPVSLCTFFMNQYGIHGASGFERTGFLQVFAFKYAAASNAVVELLRLKNRSSVNIRGDSVLCCF